MSSGPSDQSTAVKTIGQLVATVASWLESESEAKWIVAHAAHLAVDLRIAAPAPCVDRLLAITGLQGHFPVTDDRAAQVLLPATPARSELFSAG